MMDWFKPYRIGFTRRWWVGLRNALSIIGAIWLIIEFVSTFSPVTKAAVDANGSTVLVAAFMLAFVAFLISIEEPQKVRFKIAHCNTWITLRFGDLFDEPGNLLFAVNEFFDGQLGDIVSPNSVHGQFIARFCNSDAVRFRAVVDPLLPMEFAAESRRAFEPKLRLPVGTTAVVPDKDRKIFLCALTRTDEKTHKASSSVPDLWHGLAMALEAVRTEGGGKAIAMPMIGGGQSDLNLDAQPLLRLLVLILVDFAKKRGLPKEVSIVLPPACFEELDIREIERDWTRR